MSTYPRVTNLEKQSGFTLTVRYLRPTYYCSFYAGLRRGGDDRSDMKVRKGKGYQRSVYVVKRRRG